MSFFDFENIIDINTEFVIFGIPWDYLTSIKSPNSAIAPQKIREVTNDLALTTELGFKIPEFKVADIGDIRIIPKEVDMNLKEIYKNVASICKQNSKSVPIMIGGDHFCTFPVFKAIGDNFSEKKKIGVIIFDAHLDLYEEWDKGVYSHATVCHRIYDLEYMNNKNLMIIGTRDIDIPEIEIANAENITYLNSYLMSELGLKNYVDKIIDFFRTSGIEYLYVSIDIDAFDPSIAPGTGFAIPGGFTYRQFWKMLNIISDNFNIIGFDLVEVAPNLDLANKVTSNLAAKIIIEFISFISNK